MIRWGRAEIPPTRRPAVPRQRGEATVRADHTDRRERSTAVDLHPYLNFPDGTAREAMEFYASVLGGELTVTTFGDLGTKGPLATQVMHGQLVAPGGLVLTGADSPPEVAEVAVDDHVSVSLSGGPQDTERLRAWFAALSEGGVVRKPLEAAPWGDELGMLTDRFGIGWLVHIARQSAC